MVVVVDASVAVKWYVAEAWRTEARNVLASAAELIAPDIILTEVANALRRKVTEGTVTKEQALNALDDLPASFSRIVHAEQTLRAAFDLALSLSHPFPDCVYLACAIMNGANLVTDDRKFLEKAVVNGHRNHVVLLADWPAQEPDQQGS
ncbi:type II toxin-antitoxin system VapC family toxin [Methylocystis sp. H62]|uniref:type II toxin-antitoxin system VapC family toxin n=1 Tax=Methylocystis sp. H62 TaxID=2785789 RepID=UPI0018C31982|nr:type II toxin-antitoxin system VapC family toxin [Methylocystis sp. H62]MBG0795922.1 type II toxin-antitoxin system VapC family toxin [Methylocystis sp. H62]